MDLNNSEYEIISEFLNKSGKSIFLMDLTKNNLSNFQKLFKSYGFQVQNALTIEKNKNTLSNNPLNIFSINGKHEIVNWLNKQDLKVLMPNSQSFKIFKTNNIKIEPFLYTSSKAYGKVKFYSTTIQKEPEDIKGPLILALAINKNNTNIKENNTKIVAISNSYFILPNISSLSKDANKEFFINSINWLHLEKDNIAIAPKDVKNYKLNITPLCQLISVFIIIFLIPLTILFLGIFTLSNKNQRLKRY